MRGLRTSGIVLLAAAGLALSACGDPKKAIAEADAAGGDKLEEYSRNIAETVDLVANPDLVQRFCKNAFASACPADIDQTLKDHGYNGGTGVDLAQAFVVILADTKDGEADLSSSDEDYLAAAYRVALARDPDAEGGADNLTYIQDSGNRKQMLRSLLESDEFRKQG